MGKSTALRFVEYAAGITIEDMKRRQARKNSRYSAKRQVIKVAVETDDEYETDTVKVTYPRSGRRQSSRREPRPKTNGVGMNEKPALANGDAKEETPAEIPTEAPYENGAKNGKTKEATNDNNGSKVENGQTNGTTDVTTSGAPAKRVRFKEPPLKSAMKKPTIDSPPTASTSESSDASTTDGTTDSSADSSSAGTSDSESDAKPRKRKKQRSSTTCIRVHHDCDCHRHKCRHTFDCSDSEVTSESDTEEPSGKKSKAEKQKESSSEAESTETESDNESKRGKEKVANREATRKAAEEKKARKEAEKAKKEEKQETDNEKKSARGKVPKEKGKKTTKVLSKKEKESKKPLPERTQQKLYPEAKLGEHPRRPQLIQPLRSQVMHVEHAVESPEDPRPNAFYDSGNNIVRVYHGPAFGNLNGRLYPTRDPNMRSLPVGTPHPLYNPYYHGFNAPIWGPPMGQPPATGVPVGSVPGPSVTAVPVNMPHYMPPGYPPAAHPGMFPQQLPPVEPREGTQAPPATAPPITVQGSSAARPVGDGGDLTQGLWGLDSTRKASGASKDKTMLGETNIAPGTRTPSGLTHNLNSPYHSGGNMERKASDQSRRSGQGGGWGNGDQGSWNAGNRDTSSANIGNNSIWANTSNQNQSRQGNTQWKPGSRVASIKSSPTKNLNDNRGKVGQTGDWSKGGNQSGNDDAWNVGGDQGGYDWTPGDNQGDSNWNSGDMQGGNNDIWNSGENNQSTEWNNNDNNSGTARLSPSKRGSSPKTSPIPSTPSNNVGVRATNSPAGSTGTVRRHHTPGNGQPSPPKPPSDNIAGHRGTNCWGSGNGIGHKNGQEKMPGSWESSDEKNEMQKVAHAENLPPWGDPTAAQSTQNWSEGWDQNPTPQW